MASVPGRASAAIKKRIRRAEGNLGAGLRRSLRRAQVTRAHLLVAVGRPVVSVVIPVYNVEPYLAACIKSVLRQTYKRLEIILVDDGSTDRSSEIAQRFARENRTRVRYVHQPNAGLGAARNTGIDMVRGRYLMFVDSDDTITRDAVRIMVRTIEKTGSDFVCGAMQRVDNGLKRVPAWVKDLHAKADLSTNIHARPDMILNVFAWGKLYSMDFWRQLGLTFPEGLYYEDQIPSAQQFLETSSFDVLPNTVYNWYLRTGTSSITQTTAEMRNLRDRTTVTHEVNAMLLGPENAAIRRAWIDTRILGNDISLYVKDVDWVDDEYYAAIRAWLTGIFAAEDWEAEFTAPSMKRLIAWALLHRDRGVVERLRQFERENPGGMPTRVSEGSVFSVLPAGLADELQGAPDTLLRLRSDRLQLASSLRTLEWVQPGVIRLAGWAYVRGIDLASSQSKIVVQLRTVDEEVVETFLVTSTPEFNVGRRSPNRWVNYDASGFTCTVDLRGVDWPENARLHVWVQVETAGFVRAGPWESTAARGGVRAPGASRSFDDAVVIPTWNRGVLQLSLTRPAMVATWVGSNGDDVLVECHGPLALTGAWVSKVTRSGARRRLVGTVHSRGGAYVVRLPGATFFDSGSEWRFRVQDATSGRAHMVLLSSDLPDHALLANRVLARRSPAGNLVLQRGAPTVLVHSSVVDADSLVWTVTGEVLGVDLQGLELRGARHQVRSRTLDLTGDGRFIVVFDLLTREWEDEFRPLAPGFYELRAVSEGRVGVTWSPRGLIGVPQEQVGGFLSVRSSRTGVPILEVTPDIGGDGTGARYQRVLQDEVYAQARLAPREPVVLFESFQGRNVTCNPLAVWEELHRRHPELETYWGVTDTSVWVPEGAQRLIRFSEEWYRVLGSAAVLVNNTNFPAFFRKAPDQVHLQTWHGTPLKKIGHDIQRVLFSYRNYLDTMDREAGSWDALISPNAYSTDIFPHAFSFEGTMWQTGYPRNDALSRPEAGAARARTRLGLDDDREVLLYAPTWRDDKFVGKPGRYKAVYHLDFEELEARFGDRFVVLVRGHSNTMTFGKDVRHPSVIDVTRYPDINDLFAVADVMITDYSSVMFDYSVTGKPMLFLAPDIADYRDRVRGFYFDFEKDAPGPIALNTGELLDHLAEMDSVVTHYADAYAAFRRKFNAAEDGRASKRVVNAMLDLTDLALSDDEGVAG